MAIHFTICVKNVRHTMCGTRNLRVYEKIKDEILLRCAYPNDGKSRFFPAPRNPATLKLCRDKGYPPSLKLRGTSAEAGLLLQKANTNYFFFS